jgi:hypothetical protein
MPAHLLTTYGQPIKSLYAQIEDAMDLALAALWPPTQRHKLLPMPILSCSPPPCSLRHAENGANALTPNKTWDNFKTAFTEAHTNLHLSQQTTQGAGFHTANQAMKSFVTETADAFANLATTTATDCQLMADLVATNKALTKQLAEKDSIIAQLQSSQNTTNNSNDRRNHQGPQTE